MVLRAKLDDPVMREAWVGDAVLHLWVREWALADGGAVDSAKVTRFVSNQFLSTVGQPDRVEAEIGRVYRQEGLEAAFAHIRSKLLPVFERQEANLGRAPSKARSGGGKRSGR